MNNEINFTRTMEQDGLHEICFGGGIGDESEEWTESERSEHDDHSDTPGEEEKYFWSKEHRHRALVLKTSARCRCSSWGRLMIMSVPIG